MKRAGVIARRLGVDKKTVIARAALIQRIIDAVFAAIYRRMRTCG